MEFERDAVELEPSCISSPYLHVIAIFLVYKIQLLESWKKNWLENILGFFSWIIVVIFLPISHMDRI